MARSIVKAADYSLGPHTFPRGWFVVAESKDLDDGPIALHYFGLDLALYRGESGRPVLLDAYCGHMGTHLAASESSVIVKERKQIEGDSIRCPYHGWRYAPDGTLDDIPYHDGPCPKSGAIRSYPVRDVMGCMGESPTASITITASTGDTIDEWGEDCWVPWELDRIGVIDLHPIEMLDNMADLHHLGPAHGAPCEFFETQCKDHVYMQRQGGFLKLFDATLFTFTWYTGPGILFGKDIFNDIQYYHIIAFTPVEDGSVEVFHGALCRGENEPPQAADRELARGLQAGALEALSADFSIWGNKRPAVKILTLPKEGPFAVGRKWYQQFFDTRANAKRYQSEINGTHLAKEFPGAIDDYKQWESSWNSPGNS